MPFIPNHLTPEQLNTVQLEGLKWTLSHVYNHSPYYRGKLDTAGIKPGDIRSIEDINHLPFTDKEDLQEDYPLSLIHI